MRREFMAADAMNAAVAQLLTQCQPSGDDLGSWSAGGATSRRDLLQLFTSDSGGKHEGRTILACGALAVATRSGGSHGCCARSRPHAQQERFQDGAALDADPVMPGVAVTPLMTVGDTLASGYRFESIPDGISLRNRGQGRVDLFVNHETGKVPFPCSHGARHRGQRGERLRQLPGEPADPQPAHGRGAGRLVRHRQQLRLPALLLELPRHQEGGLQPRHPLHERGVARLRVPPGGLVAAARSATRTRRRPASSWRSTSRAASTTRSTAWAGTTTRTASPIPGYGKPVVLSGDDTFTSGPLSRRGVHAGRRRRSRSSTRTSRRTRRACWRTRATCGPSCRTRRA